LFEFFELASQALVCREGFAQAHEGAHHIEAHLDRARGVEYGGGHERAMLGKRQGEFAPAAAPLV